MINADALRQLQQRAVEAASQSGQIDDIEKTLNISRQLTDLEKADADTANQPKLLRYEEFKTWAALIVPFLSIATLAVTIFIQAEQLKATREASEATEWRETVKNVLSQLNKPRSVVADPALAMSLLEPYTSNVRFGKDAKLLGVGLLSRVPSSDRFRDYFLSHHIGVDESDIPFLTDLNRELNSDLAEVDGRLAQPSPPEVLGPAHDALVGDIEFLTGRLCALYRLSAKATDFRDVFLFKGDLSGIDLTAADLTGARFEDVDLTNALLDGDVTFKDAHLVNSNWWEARMIAKPVLGFLLAEDYPYQYPQVTYGHPPQKAHYTERVLQLCQSVGMVCKPESLKFGTPSSPSEAPQANK